MKTYQSVLFTSGKSWRFSSGKVPVLIKVPLLALLCFSTVELASSQLAQAGKTPVTLPDSSGTGVSDTLSPFATSGGGAIASQISQGIAAALQTLQTERSVPSVGDTTLPLSSETVGTISMAAASGTNSDITALEQLLSEEVGAAIDVSVLETSPENLRTATAAINEVVVGLSSEELAAAIDSPTFMSVLQLFKGANEAIASEAVSSEAVSTASSMSFGVLQLSLE